MEEKMKTCERCKRENPADGYTYPEGTMYCPRCGAMLPEKSRSRAPIFVAFALLALLLVGVGTYVVTLFRAPDAASGTNGTSAQRGDSAYDTPDDGSYGDTYDGSYGDTYDDVFGDDYDEADADALEALFDDPTPENYVAFLTDSDVGDEALFEAYLGFLEVTTATKAQNIAVAQAIRDYVDGYLSRYLLLYRYAYEPDESLLLACDDVSPVWKAFDSQQLLDMASVMLDMPAKDLSWSDIARVEMLRFTGGRQTSFAATVDSATYRLRGDMFDRAYPMPIAIEDYAGISTFFRLKELHVPTDLTTGSDLYIMHALETLGIDATQPDYEVLASIPNLHSLTNAGYVRDLDGIDMLGETLTSLSLNAREGLLLDALLKLPHLTSLTITNAEYADVETIGRLTGLTELDLRDVPDSLSFLEPLTNLTRLRIKNCDAKTITPLKGMTRLTDLALDSMKNLDDLSAIGDFDALRAIELNCSGVKEYGFLSKLKNLEVADFQYVKSLQPLESLPKLHTLTLSWPGSISSLKKLPSLTSLTLKSVNAPDRELSFEGLNLTSLSLYNCSFYKNEDSVFSNRGLRRLDIRGGTFCADFSKISRLTELEELYLAGVELARSARVSGGGGVYSISTDKRKIDEYGDALGKLTNLRWMRLSNMDLKDVSFVSRLTGLSEAYVPDNRIEDASAFLTLPNLRVLDVSRNALSGTAGLSRIPFVVTEGAGEADPFFL